MNWKFLGLLIFSLTLLGCPSSPPNEPRSPNGSQPKEALAPVWQQTEYIFYNRTGGQITFVLVEEGKLRKKDGTVVERSDGSAMGEDGIVRDYIINDHGQQEYVIREYKETPLNLRDGECVLTPSFYLLDIKSQGKLICSSAYRHGSPDPKRTCDDEIKAIQMRKGWIETERRNEGSFPYVEFYNIVNRGSLFEGAKNPQELNNSFTHSCRKLFPANYEPWNENDGESDDGGLRTL